MTEYNINSQFTLLERFKGTSDGKKFLPLLDVMDKRGCPGFFADVPYFEANAGIQHNIRRTTSDPVSSRRAGYDGVAATAITTQRVSEPVILFEQWSSIDEQEQVGLINFQDERNKRRRISLRSIMQDVVDAIFNDARTSGPTYINGLAQRCNILSYPGHSTTTLPYVWDNGGTAGTGYLTSAYMVEWGEEACHGLFPSAGSGKGGPFGINAVDLGLQKVVTGSSPQKVYRAFEDQFTKWFGLCTNDDRKFCRIANIETRTTETAGRFNEDVIIRAIAHGRFNIPATRVYVNPFLKADIDIRAKNMLNGWNIQQVFGESVTTFLNIPIRVIDDTIIGSTETAIS